MESLATHQTVCDNCGKVLTDDYRSTKAGRDSMSMNLKVHDADADYDYNKQHHFCNEGCALAHLQERAKGNKKNAAKASMTISQASLILDVTASPNYQKSEIKGS